MIKKCSCLNLSEKQLCVQGTCLVFGECKAQKKSNSVAKTVDRVDLNHKVV